MIPGDSLRDEIATRPVEVDGVQDVAARLNTSGALNGWRVTSGDRGFWREYSPLGPAGPDAGTKIHVSSSIENAAEVLSRCGSILLDRRVAFKHASNLKRLSFLSSGRGGPSQVGKFITVYPHDDATARDLAQALHEVTLGLSGPRIPGEQPYADGSLVFFRYGAFIRQWVQVCSGRIVPAIRIGDRWEVDERAASRLSSAHANHRQHQSAAPAGTRVLRDKYVRVQRLAQSPKGSTFLGFVADSDVGDLVIIKEAYAHTMEDLRGVDARRRLRDEFRCLTDIETADIAPTVVDYWETPDSSFLVYTPIEGATLASILSSLAGHGLRPPLELLRSWASSLCTVVNKLHQCGYVSSDIKPSNLVMTSDRIFIIDLELAGPQTDAPTGGMGTRGYSSPQQISHRHGRNIADDVYAIGATLLAMATLSDASVLPDLGAVAALEAKRSPDNPAYEVIGRCVNDDASQRLPSASAIATHVMKNGRESRMPIPVPPAEPYIELASRIGDRILASAVRPSEKHSYWLSNHSTMNGQVGRDLYCGSAGIALYLCALFGETGKREFLDEALRCGTWLWESEPVVPRQTPMPGLYFGDCGVALLYLRLYQLTHHVEWLDRARIVADGVQDTQVISPDLMTGLAGVGLFHLALWRTSDDKQALERAQECARQLLDRRLPDRPVWRFPEDFDVFGGAKYVGFAHGSAGIGYFLAECVLASEDTKMRAQCQEIADWLVNLAEPALVDGTGLTWAVSEAVESPYMSAWCHGAPGIARFLLRAHDVTADRTHLDAALCAARMVARGAPWAGTTQCHGLAGNLDVLMDAFLVTGSQEHLTAANELGENLRVYETPAGWQSDELSTGCFDLMVGESGVGAAFLRLANPQLPHLISCAAFESV